MGLKVPGEDRLWFLGDGGQSLSHPGVGGRRDVPVPQKQQCLGCATALRCSLRSSEFPPGLATNTARFLVWKWPQESRGPSQYAQ